MAHRLESRVLGWIDAAGRKTGAFSVASHRIVDRAEYDLVVDVAPTGAKSKVRLLVEAKARVTPQIALGALERATPHRPNEVPILCSPSISDRVTEICRSKGVGYLDEAGNCHLEGPGLFVHVEGRQPPKEPMPAPGRPQKGWIKTVMAILIRPELTNAPYRTLAEQADVALGTLAGCMNDLAARGLLLDGKGGRKVADRDARGPGLWVGIGRNRACAQRVPDWSSRHSTGVTTPVRARWWSPW